MIVGDRDSDNRALTADELDALGSVPADGKVHAIDISGLGSYRVVALDGRLSSGDPATLVTGLPTKDVDDTLGSLILTETLLALLAVLAAGGIGTVVVRRQLRPLREVAATAHAVAALPLATGAISLEERVPAHLTDERTEVGQVGSAINTMLEHVESSLTARHRSEQQVRQFVADASHELRTPLTTIAGYTELARRHPDDRAAADTALAKVEEESGRMTALVEDLLLLARLDAGRPLASEPVDLTRLLIEAVSDARVLAPDHHWRLSLPDDVGRGHRRRAAAAPGRHQPADQRPQVHPCRHHRHRLRPPGGFAVHDDGPGFPPDLVDHAFERFARGDAARTACRQRGRLRPRPVAGPGRHRPRRHVRLGRSPATPPSPSTCPRRADRRTRSHRRESLDDHVGDLVGHLVGQEEDVARHRDDLDPRTGLEHGPLVRSEAAVAALLCVHHPPVRDSIAEPLGAVVVAGQPAHVLQQGSTHGLGRFRSKRPQLGRDFPRAARRS